MSNDTIPLPEVTNEEALAWADRRCMELEENLSAKVKALPKMAEAYQVMLQKQIDKLAQERAYLLRLRVPLSHIIISEAADE